MLLLYKKRFLANDLFHAGCLERYYREKAEAIGFIQVQMLV